MSDEEKKENVSSQKKNRFFRIPQTKDTVKMNVVLAIGLLLGLTGIYTFVTAFSPRAHIFLVRPAVFFALTAIFIFLAFGITANGVLVCAGVFCFLTGLFMLFMDLGFLGYGMEELWPVFSIIFGISLIPAGLYKMKRVKSIYLFPAILFILLGILFLLFSAQVIKVSFSKIMVYTFPLLLLAGGAVLIILFLVQNHKKNIFPVLKDDSLDDGTYRTSVEKFYIHGEDKE